MQGPPIQGQESVPTFPSLPLFSLQLEEERDRADGYLRQSVMYLQSPQKSVQDAAIRLTGEPKTLRVPCCPTAAGSQPQQQDSAQWLWYPDYASELPATLSHPCFCALYMAQPCQGEEDMWPGWQHWCWGAVPLG